MKVAEEPLGAADPSALLRAGPQTEFDIYAPGIMIFALLMIIPQTAMLVAREVRWGTLRRLHLTRLRAWDLLTGVSLAQMIVAVVQVVVMFAGALAVGFHNQGSLLLAIVVELAVSFSAVGKGLVVAPFDDVHLGWSPDRSVRRFSGHSRFSRLAAGVELWDRAAGGRLSVGGDVDRFGGLLWRRGGCFPAVADAG
ncbi:MAG: hypothetical protein V3S14_15325 [Anaerolineae bacterium]